MKLNLKDIFVQEQIVTDNKYNWKLHPVNGPKLWDLFKSMGNESLYFNPKGSSVEETDQDKKATGAWLPSATNKNHLVATDMQKKEIYATSLKDPRVATALISSAKYIPEILSYNVIVPVYGGKEKNAGALKDVLKKTKEIKGKSPSWQKGMYKSKDDEKYKEFKFEVLEDLSDHKWYHATSLQHLNSILSKGLITSGEVDPGQGWTGFSVNLQDAVYLTASENYALDIAETMLSKTGTPGVVLEISGDALKDKTKMVIDEDVLYNSFVEDFSYKNIVNELPDYLISAISSRFSSVGYRDKIDKKFINPIHVVAINEKEDEVYIYPWDEWNKNNKQDRELEEFNAIGTGAVVGYGIPLGMKPNYDKLGTGKKNSKKKSKHWYEVNENTVPQGGPDDRPLHGPTYFYPFGRSIPKNKRDNGGQSKARKWNKDGSLVDVKKIEKNSKSKEQWYKNETFEENDETFLEILRQDSPWSVEDVKKTTRKRSKKNKSIKEVSSLATAAIEASNIEPDEWDRDDALRVNKKSVEKNKKYIEKLDVTQIDGKNGLSVCIDHMDPQYKRQISMIKNPDEVVPCKEPVYLKGQGEHRISKLGYAKIADRKNDLQTDVYLSPYDPNWRRSKEMVQKIIKHNIDNHGNRKRIYPEPDASMMVSIKEAWKEIVEEHSEPIYYHGTNQEFKPGDILQPPNITNNISEKGRKKNLNKVFFTLDKGSAKIYAGRAVQSLGGKPHVYIVKPSVEPEWINKTKGTTILIAPTVEIIEEI